MLAIPGRGIGQVVNLPGKSLMLVIRVGQCDLFPVCVVALCRKAALVGPHLHQPTTIKVVAVAGEGRKAQTD